MKKTVIIAIVAFVLFHITAPVSAGFFDFLRSSQDVLTVEGNKLLLNEKEVFLRGVAVGDSHSRQTVDGRTSKDYEVLKKEWKANLVRLSIHPGVWNKDQKKGKKILEEEVKVAREQGMIVIIDWHVIGMPNDWYKPTKWGVDHYYSYSSNFNTAKEFWKYAALEFRSDRGVIFELWNEPARPDNDPKWDELKPYMDRLHDIIRSNGAKNIIMAPGVWWTYDLRGIKNDPIDGENIVYAWHNYPGNQKVYIKWNTALDGLHEKYPIFVTEWGFSDDTLSGFYDERFGNDFLEFMKNRNMHFTAWCWHGTWKPTLLQYDWTNLTDAGRLVKNYLNDFDSGINLTDNDIPGLSSLSTEDKQTLQYFVDYGVDDNSRRIGRGERLAVIFSFLEAFERLPQGTVDMEDVRLISNGRWPKQRSDSAENRALTLFKRVYMRQANMDNQNDNAAVTIMSYGLRQQARNRSLESERRAFGFYNGIFGRLPSSTEDWNVLQAITYSGAVR